MRIAIGADHAGFEMKEHLARFVAASGHAVTDLGTHDEDPVDYPDFAAAVGRAVAEGRADRGIVVCGSGAGASIAANKVKGVRAVLTVGSRVIGSMLAEEVVGAFLGAEFTGEERHMRRLGKIADLEERF